MQQGVESYQRVEHHDDLTGFVQEHSPLIQKIARNLKNHLPQHIEFDDLLQSGLMGLLEAKGSFSEEAGASFVTYASLKIRCAMYEFVRKNSGITRDISQNIKKISEVVTRLDNEDDVHTHSDSSIASELGVSLKKYADMTREISTYKSVSSHEVSTIDDIPDEDKANPLYCVEEDDEKSMIKSMLQCLPKREQIILALYYNEQMNLKEIADIMDLTEARISQIHTTCLAKLKQKLTYQYETEL